MELKSTVTLLMAILGYAITVLLGLIQGKALSTVFIDGIKILIMTIVFIYIIFLLMEVFSKENKNDNKNNSDSGENSNIDKSTNEKNKIESNTDQEFSNSTEDNSFSPLNPTVLETKEQERGEGN
ncbi:MAG: hypothetical protein ACOCRU_01585 [bacterium]